MRRFLVFLHYDPEGHVDEAVLHTLRGFRPHVEHTVVVVNGFLDAESKSRLEAEADEVFERENHGFDAGAYRSVLGHIGYDKLNDYDELLLVNYTFFGPVASFDELFARMDARPVDFWGLTHHTEIDPHPLTGKGVMPEHLQSYWIAFRKSLFATHDFRAYWAGLRDAFSYNDVITIFETQLTRHFADLGFVWESAFANDQYGAQNISMEAPLALLNEGGPIFKRRVYFHDLADMDLRGVSGKEVTDRAIELGYPRDLIIDGVIRRASARQLNTGLGLSYVHARDRVAAVSEIMPVPDVLPVVDREFWKGWLRDGVSPFIDSDVVMVMADQVEHGYKNDATVGRHRRAMNAIVGHAADNLQALRDDPRVGLIVPLTEHRGSALLADGWQGRRKAATELATLLNLRGPLDKHAPLTPYLGIAMYRAEAFASLSGRVKKAGGWDALAHLFGGDETLVKLFTLLAADIAKTDGYLTAQATTLADLLSSHSLLVEKYASVSGRFAPHRDAPLFGDLANPGSVIRRDLGIWLRGKSPTTAAVIVSGEKAARRALRPVKRLVERILNRRGGAL